MKKIACVFFVTICVSAAAAWYWWSGQSEIRQAKSLISNMAKDPESVKFRNVIYRRETTTVCGEFNAKNAFGAYVGFDIFFRPVDGDAITISTDSPEATPGLLSNPGSKDISNMSLDQLTRYEKELGDQWKILNSAVKRDVDSRLYVELCKNSDIGRWEEKEKGVVDDTVTDMQWTQHDNLVDIDWHDAKAHCASLKLAGGGWRLPTMQELSQVYTADQDGTTPCGVNLTCRVSPKFYLTRPAIWSGDVRENSGEAWYMSLSDGDRHSYTVFFNFPRALCVRRRS